MVDIRMFRTISGEDVIAEFIGEKEGKECYQNLIQLMVVPSKQNPQEMSYGFAPYPQYARPKTENKIWFNSSNIVFYTDIDDDFLQQYNMVFGHVVTPTQQIFTGR